MSAEHEITLSRETTQLVIQARKSISVCASVGCGSGISLDEAVAILAKRYVELLALREVLDRVITEAIEHWHDGPSDSRTSLHEWLGLSWSEYATWVERGTGAWEKS